MAGLITVADLAARPGFENLDSVQAQSLIDDASALARLAADPLLDAVESPDTHPAIVAVVVAMIRRGFSNPMGHQSENLGDYAYTAGTTGGVASLYLTARERKIVRRAAGAPSVGSLDLTVDLPEQPSDAYYGTSSEDLTGS
ncbi:MAG TPA: hypothetical protein VK611_25210 [Acidimicrobiales bacterium]|nr:hypothetical protein [Acidimicrobiales bacterium]